MDRKQLLTHLTDDAERLLGARALDLAEQAIKREAPVPTDFLDPREAEVVEGVLGSIPRVFFRSYGGYRQAERKRYLVFPDYYLVDLLETPISALEIRGDFLQPPAHRVCLGALLGLGIERSQVGDLLPQDNGFQVLVARELQPFIEANFTRVGRTRITVEPIDFERLAVEPERVKDIRVTVASMRLDALAAAGFGTSRSKMAREIRAERVKLNWKLTTNPSAAVSEGDIISIRGRGRVHVESVQGETRKGRIAVHLKRMF